MLLHITAFGECRAGHLDDLADGIGAPCPKENARQLFRQDLDAAGRAYGISRCRDPALGLCFMVKGG